MVMDYYIDWSTITRVALRQDVFLAPLPQRVFRCCGCSQQRITRCAQRSMIISKMIIMIIALRATCVVGRNEKKKHLTQLMKVARNECCVAQRVVLSSKKSSHAIHEGCAQHDALRATVHELRVSTGATKHALRAT